MLKLSEINLKKNLLLVEEYPLDIKPQTDGGIHKTEEQMNAERAQRRFRIGKIIKWGALDDNLVEEIGLDVYSVGPISLSDEDEPEWELIPNQNIFYTADAVELVDYPVEGTQRLLLINLHNIIGVIDFEDSKQEVNPLVLGGTYTEENTVDKTQEL